MSGKDQDKYKASEKGRKKDEQIKGIAAGGEMELFSGDKENDKHRAWIIGSTGEKKRFFIGQGAIPVKFSRDFSADRITGEDAGGDQKVFEWFFLHIRADQGR